MALNVLTLVALAEYNRPRYTGSEFWDRAASDLSPSLAQTGSYDSSASSSHSASGLGDTPKDNGYSSNQAVSRTVSDAIPIPTRLKQVGANRSQVQGGSASRCITAGAKSR